MRKRKGALLGLPLCLGFAFPRSSDEINLAILSPKAADTVEVDSVFISARVTPMTYEITSVRYVVEGKDGWLQYAGYNIYSAKVSLAGIPKGIKSLTLTATNALGATKTGTVEFPYFDPPLSLPASEAQVL